ncbi:uncharacterized protein LOC62_01G000611 [Vanrija pseudolonga]|uniref:Uncharacterized protein n=1 Tax=Vanrija pseudolonga TaxID=143232 RepID=A0AAF1BH30_9TREE|nr:hypothetical protein LOC62_01G000611 [Vanrija pseudolonga]
MLPSPLSLALYLPAPPEELPPDEPTSAASTASFLPATDSILTSLAKDHHHDEWEHGVVAAEARERVPLGWWGWGWIGVVSLAATMLTA